MFVSRALVLAALSAGCAFGGDIEVVKDLPYGPHPAHKFDWYKAQKAAPPTPVVVFVHGGHSILDKTSILKQPDLALLEMLVENGIAVMAVDDRPIAHFTYPAQGEDVAMAIQYLRAHATTFGIDPAGLVLWGHSSGGAIATWLAYGVDHIDPLGDLVAQQSSRPDAVLNWRGLTNWTLMLDDFPGTLFGKPKLSDVGPATLVEASGSLAVLNVQRTFTPPIFSYYNFDESTPPLFNPHDATLMKDLHAHLAGFAEAAANSVPFQTPFFPQVVYTELEAQVDWIRARAGETGPLSVGLGKPGTGGVVPVLSASGSFTPGGSYTFSFQASTPQASTLILFVGFGVPAYAKFLGGTLVPQPNLAVQVPTATDGSQTLTGTLPHGPAIATVAYLQFWQADPQASFGVAASNGLRIVIQ